MRCAFVLLLALPAAALAQPVGPGSAGAAYAAVDAFPNLTFQDPTFLAAVPRSTLLAVAGREGKIWTVSGTGAAATATLFLDLSARTQGWSDSGILGLAFHPEYGEAGSPHRGYVYVYYNYTPGPQAGSEAAPPNYQTPSYDRLSRFTVPDGSSVVDPSSEVVLINQFDRDLWHNGGAMFFGPDGYLYLSVGDEGGVNNQYGMSQQINVALFGGVLRLDVNENPATSHPIRRQPEADPGATVPAGWPATYTQNYYIPNDNPWVDPGGGNLEEFWAIGLRSPHRMTLDPATGSIWLGDVGQDNYEEIDLIQKGGNYQWAYMEGFHPGPSPKPATLIGTDSPPIYEYPHSDGNGCVIGGYVYHGSLLPGLDGQYLFGDYNSNRIWSMSYGGSGTPVVNFVTALPPAAGTYNGGLSSFGLDAKGEVYLCTIGPNAHIYTLVPAVTTPPATTVPPTTTTTPPTTTPPPVTTSPPPATPPPAPIVVAPVILTTPVGAEVAPGGNATLTVVANGTPSPTYQWQINGTAIAGATGSSLVLSNVTAAAAGSYRVVVSNSGGSIISAPAIVVLESAPGIVAQPANQTASAGAAVSFSVTASGLPAPTYQWQKNGAPLSGATDAILSLSAVQTSDAASYTVVATNPLGSATSQPATLTISAPPSTVQPQSSPPAATITPPATATPSARLINVSVRSYSGSADDGLAVGLVIGGSGSKWALLRAVGPTLSQFGVTGVMANPVLTIYNSSSAQIASSGPWGGGATLSNAFVQTGAFPLPATSADAALLTNLPVGLYSAAVTTTDGGSGVVLLEAYDADTASPPSARFVNLSVRGYSGSASAVLTVGFVVTGSGQEQLLIRGIGPSLANFGVTGWMADPMLTVYDANEQVVASNDNWAGSPALTAAFSQVGAFALDPGSKDAALIFTASPGLYTVQLTGVGGGTGIGLIELYELP